MHRTCWSQSQGAEQTSIECDRCDALRCLQMYHASDVHPVLTKKTVFWSSRRGYLGAGKGVQANADRTVSFSGRT